MKIGILSLPVSGHLNPMSALARKLQSRGNEIVFFGLLDSGPAARAANLNFVPFAEKEYPLGYISKTFSPVAKLRGAEVVQYTFSTITPGLIESALEHLPEKLAETGVEALVLDSLYFFVELIPMRLGMPYAQVWNVVNFDFSGTTPVCAFTWPHENTPEARARNTEGVKIIGEMLAPIVPIAMNYAEKAGLQINWTDPAATTSKLAVISQIPKEFDFPDIPWAAAFRYAGPLHDGEGREPVEFPWERLTDKPLIYASLGTLLNGLEDVYRAILDAVKALPDVQMVLSVGNNLNPADLGPIPSNTIVVSTAPQIELLKRAALCITHAGLNTTLESLAQGVPMVAIPISYDQPGAAARIAYHGAGEFVELEDLTAERLLGLIRTVLTNPSYRARARDFQQVIAQTHGLDIAADAIERAFNKNQAMDRTKKVPELSHA